MSQRCNILSNSGAALNNAGGRSAQAATWVADTNGPYPCRIWRQRDFALEGPEGGEETSAARYKCSLPFGTLVGTTNRIQLIDGPTYEVLGVDASHADAIQAICDIKVIG